MVWIVLSLQKWLFKMPNCSLGLRSKNTHMRQYSEAVWGWCGWMNQGSGKKADCGFDSQSPRAGSRECKRSPAYDLLCGPGGFQCIFTHPTEENTTFWTNSVLIQMKHKALWIGLFLKYKLKIVLLNHTRNIHMCMQIYSCICMYRLIYLHEYINYSFYDAWVWSLDRGRYPGGGHSNPLQYTCLEDPRDRGAWRATLHRITKSWTQLKQLSTHKSILMAKRVYHR